MKTAEIAGSTFYWFYRKSLSSCQLRSSGEAVMLAMRTNVEWI